MTSVFREPGWREKRHFLNPSKWKEYELHIRGLGFLNKFNFFKNHFEKFTPIDPLTQDEIDKMHRKATIHLIRKEISGEEKGILEKNGFSLVYKWGTLIIDTYKKGDYDSNTIKNIRKGSDRLIFSIAKERSSLKKYYELLKLSRKSLGFRTPSYKNFSQIFNNKFYSVFIVTDNKAGKIVAGIGAIYNSNYMLETNSARDKQVVYANDFLKLKLIEFCRENHIRWYDLAGINPNPLLENKDYFIRKYKEKWGGEFYNEFVYER